MKYILSVAMMVVLLGGCTASKQAVRDAIRENPEIVIEALEDNTIKLYELVEKGAREKQLAKKAEKWRMQAADPVKPVIEEGRASLGNKDAPITIVEYSDFLCPYCSQGARTVNNLVEESEGKLRVIFKHSPRNDASYKLALMYEAIALQDPDKAWAFGERLFDSQRAVFEGGDQAAFSIAEELGVNVAQLKKDMNNTAVIDRIHTDAEEGAGFGVNGTPTFFVNGVRVVGAVPEAQFLKVLEIVEEVQDVCLDCEN